MKKASSFTGFIMLTIASFWLQSCSKDDSEEPLIVTPASISMHYEDTQQLSAEGATSWLSNDEFVAKVNSSGLITANHVGTTEIIVSNGKKNATCSVTVTPEYYLYDDPILNWGASKAEIESAEKHKKVSSSNSDMLTFDYSFGSNACVMGYSFENGKLKNIMAMFDYSLYLRAGYYLLERYQPIAAGNDYDYVLIDALKKEKCKTIVYFAAYKSGKTTYTTIMYSDYSSIKSASTRSVAEYNPEMNKMQETLVGTYKQK